jgi:hypothetical protein
MLEHMIEMKKKDPGQRMEPGDYKTYHDSTGVTLFLPQGGAGHVRTEMNNVILEGPGCLNMCMASTFRVIQVGERTWGTRCRCGNIIEFSFDCLDPTELWA